MRRVAVAIICLALACTLFGVGYWLGTRSDDPAGAIGGDDRPTVRRCFDWTKRAPTPAEIYGGCAEPGEALIGFAVTDCVSGPDLFDGQIGWGYIGEPMRTDPLDERTRATCEGWVDELVTLPRSRTTDTRT